MNFRSLIVVTTSCVCCVRGFAAVITSDTVIGASDFSYDNQNLVISNATVTCDGPHSLLSLRVATGAALTHLDPSATATNAGLFLTIANDVEVEPGALVNANGRGYASESGPGAGHHLSSPQDGSGAAYGGNGGLSSSNAPAGIAYGSAFAADQLGSGGGTGAGGSGGSGGGLIQLTVGGRAILNGAISANGDNATNSRAGGGSGGAISVSATSIEGAGAILANGGAGEPIHGGGGGGGRLVLISTTNVFTGSLSARGGSGWQIGGAGTIVQSGNATNTTLLVDNKGNVGALTPLDSTTNQPDTIIQGRAAVSLSSSVTLGSMVLHSNASILSTAANATPLTLIVAGDAILDSGTQLTMDGKGYAADTGPGLGLTSGSAIGGSGHAGYGGSGVAGLTVARGGTTYGSSSSPNTGGSGGRSLSTSIAGPGGGIILLTVGGTLTLDGKISADATLTPLNYGGGSGGSIWLSIGALKGVGTVSANGASGVSQYGGGGGGGRIALYCSTNLFAGTVSAHGGSGTIAGGAGTIYTTNLISGYTSLLVDNGGLQGTNTFLDLTRLTDLSLTRGGSITSSFPSVTVTSLVVAAGSFWFSTIDNGGLTVTSNALVTGTISLDGVNALSSTGQGNPASTGSGGGGNGGVGGRGVGAGGGLASGTSSTGGTAGGRGGAYTGTASGGGGIWRMTVGGLLTLDGRVTANGLTATSNFNGGGAGGGLVMTVGGLAGSGLLAADGGGGHLPQGGGGAGGRILLTYTSNSFTGTYSAKGGAGYANGAAGTICLKRLSAPGPLVTLIIDNGGLPGTNTVLDQSSLQELYITGGAFVTNQSSSTLVCSNFVIGTNSTLATSFSQWTLTASNITVAGVLSGNGVSFSGNNGGVGGLSGPGGGGGGAGAGGAGLSVAGGSSSSSPANQLIPGGPGGGSGSGGGGGGALRITAAGLLSVDGSLSASGGNGTTNMYYGGMGGGGGGGSIWVTVGTFSGSGLVGATGGNGWPPSSGGGGGGRLGIYYRTNLFHGSFSARAGTGYNNGGAGTIYLKQTDRTQGNLLFDNATLATGAATLWDGSMGSLSEVILTGGCSVTSSISSLTVSNLTIGSNAFLSLPSFANLTLSGTGSVAQAGGIIADGISLSTQGGLNSSSGSGGAGHAGTGGAGLGLPGGVTTGFASTPTTVGFRGGSFFGTGPNGGGAFHLTVSGMLQVNGRVSANGLSGLTNATGGGSGGSVWLTLGGLSGNGVISADGGAGHLPESGGGGGGRVAVYFNSNSFAGTLSARGGAGWQRGGAGTIYIKTNSATFATLLVDNGGLRGTNTDVNPSAVNFDLTVQGGGLASSIGSPRDLSVRSNGWIGLGALQSVSYSISRNVTVDNGGGIVLDGSGASSAGIGLHSVSAAGGGGHGGYGGRKSGANGLAYDSVFSPALAGSPGGNGSGSSAAPLGGKGGGALHLTVGSTLTMNGNFTASGLGGDSKSGGGSGGSIWINTPVLAGSGTITANGGTGNFSGAGGSGGRIALYAGSNLFSGTFSAAGGTGFESGAAGTLYVQDNAHTNGLLTLDNAGACCALTPLSQTSGIPVNISVGNGAAGQFQGALPLLSNVVVVSGGRLTGSSLDTNLNLAVQGDLSIAAAASIDADGSGSPTGTGLGAGASLNNKGAGGGYGGPGGASSSGVAGGSTYGSLTQPIDRGSGGGAGFGSPDGSQGGGALRISAGHLTVDGKISARGNDGLQDDSGGGSGGSVWLTAGTLTGNGIISADGGAGELYGGGGGGGGRIAIYSPGSAFTGQFSVAGGSGAFIGSTGTVYFSSAFSPLTVISQSPFGIVSNAVGAVTLGFNSPIDPATLTNAQVSLLTPAGALPANSFTLSQGGLALVTVSFPSQNLPGDYELHFGPGLGDFFGQPMSQVYTGSFTLSLPLILGTVRGTNGVPVAGVTIQQTSGNHLSALTDSNGAYSLAVDSGWTGSIAASFSNMVLLPRFYSYIGVTATVSNQDFIMAPTFIPAVGVTLQNNLLSLGWYGISNVTYQVYSSTNLTIWDTYLGSLPGTNGPAIFEVPVEPATPARFFEVQPEY
jgi:hypothetical protein